MSQTEQTYEVPYNQTSLGGSIPPENKAIQPEAQPEAQPGAQPEAQPEAQPDTQPKEGQDSVAVTDKEQVSINKLPAEATPEQVDEFYKSLGASEKPEDYKISEQIPEGLRGMLAVDLAAARATPEQQKMYEQHILKQIGENESKKEALIGELKKEWGDNYDSNYNLALDGLAAIGVDAGSPTMNNLFSSVKNDKQALEALVKLGRFAQEGSMTKEERAASLASAQATFDSFVQQNRVALYNTSHPNHADLKREENALYSKVIEWKNKNKELK